MPLSVLLNQRKPGEIGNLVLDALLTESHKYDSDVTEHPVEVGSKISDHIEIKPPDVSMSGMVSRKPIKLLASLTESPTRDDDAYRLLLEIMESKELVTIVTMRETYDDMVLKSFTTDVDVRTAQVFKFSASFKKLTTVDTQTFELPAPEKPSQSKKKKKGKKSTKEASDKVQGKAKEQTAAFKLFGGS